MTWLYKAIATLHLLYGSLFLQAQDAVSQRNYQKLEKIMKTTREDEVRNSKTKTWEENMGQNHITVSEENRQRLRKLLKGVPEFPTNLFEEAGKLTADTKQFDEKYNQIEREREVWKENLERCFGKFTRILKKEDAERKGTPFIIPRDVYFYHEKKAVRALD